MILVLVGIACLAVGIACGFGLGYIAATEDAREKADAASEDNYF